jgi:hypothetical protein
MFQSGSALALEKELQVHQRPENTYMILRKNICPQQLEHLKKL